MEISTSRQVCMDYSSDHWLQGTINEEEDGLIMDSSSSPPCGDHNILMTCSSGSGPLIETKLRPPHHDQSLKCPRCDSTHTKFCYYNNYSLTQPRYFCKSCRRYWTKGGTLRNIPVGGGCRKNKKLVASSSKKSSTTTTNNILQNQEPTHDHDLQLSYPEMAFSHFNNNLVGSNNACGFMFENHIPIDFMESKYEALLGTSTAMNHQDFLENGQNITTNSYGFAPNFSTMDVNNNYDGTVVMDGYEVQINNAIDLKQNHRLNLSLDQQGFSESGKESFGYIGTGGLGSWTGFMSTGYGSSAPNPLL